MIIGEDMTCLISHEARTRPARDAIEITCPEIGNSLPCRYEDDGLSGIAEQVDIGAFICS